MNWLDVLVTNAVRGTILLLAAWCGAVCLRRSSAAVRHFVWTAAFTGLLLLPAVQWLSQSWSLPIAPATPLARAALGESAPAAGVAAHVAGPHTASWPVVVWMVGAAGCGAWLLLGMTRVRRIVSRGVPADFVAAMPVPVLVSEAAAVPMACGFRRPAIVLPGGAGAWPAAQLRAVLLHEFAHIRRRDLLTHFLGRVACCLYWFHPVVWLAARQHAVAREHACDDAVLASGVAAADYATHLMDLARSLHGRAVCAPAMAASSHLESRIRGVLDRGRSRRPLHRAAAVAIVCAAMVLVVPGAAIRAQAAPVLLAGIVHDTTGARIAGAAVTARSLDRPGEDPVVTRTDPVGAYRFPGLTPGRYAVQFAVPGFAAVNREVTLASAQGTELDISLTVGSVQESVTVRGHRTAPAISATAPPRIRVGGNVQPARLYSQTRPQYPPELQQAGISGAVVVKASISTSGEPVNLEVLDPGPDSRLAQAAMDAVRQWRYQPALLNGEPVQVDTKITVEFRLDQ